MSVAKEILDYAKLFSEYEEVQAQLRDEKVKYRFVRFKLRKVMTTLQGLLEDSLSNRNLIKSIEELCDKYPERL